MRTSRIYKDTAHLVAALSSAPTSSRSSRTSLRRSARKAYSEIKPEDENLEEAFDAELDGRLDAHIDADVNADLEEQGSRLKGLASDIEDAIPTTPLKKRKRGADAASSTTTPASSTTRTSTSRVSPRKRPLKVENADERPAKQRRKPARKVVNESGEVEIHPPSNWENVYDAIREMRARVLAPVDTMGCETLAEPEVDPKTKRYQTLTALMLSSQTKDTTTAAAMRQLQRSLPAPGGLTLANMLAVEPATLNQLIGAVGFHNNKTRYLKATALLLAAHHDGDIPATVDGLLALPGVGPKMAYLCMSAAWGRHLGVGVDVHVHRITNRLGWHRTRTPEETRAALEAWLPRERWHEINHLLVGFGQTICAPVGRWCGRCVLADKGWCPSRVVGGERGWKRKKEEEEAEDEKEGDFEDKEVVAEIGNVGGGGSEASADIAKKKVDEAAMVKEEDVVPARAGEVIVKAEEDLAV